ncbi:MAG: hypothetical protein FWG23_03030 [Eggerthellaceae bacterium]|jgi:hypothetical protein|nr:hypothetical protein [Eggerthellaceae bacterium]
MVEKQKKPTKRPTKRAGGPVPPKRPAASSVAPVTGGFEGVADEQPLQGIPELPHDTPQFLRNLEQLPQNAPQLPQDAAPPPERGPAQPMRSVATSAGRAYENRSRERYGGGGQSEKPRRGLRIPQLAFLTLLLALLALAGLFVWDRWFHYDDEQDFVGVWTLVNPGIETTTVVLIDDETIELAPDVHYAYQLDTWKKSITYTFGDLKGSGIYRFSADRNTLVIIEGGASSWVHDVKVALDLAQPGDGEDPEKTTSLARSISSTGPTAEGGLSLGVDTLPDAAGDDGADDNGDGADDAEGGADEGAGGEAADGTE